MKESFANWLWVRDHAERHCKGKKIKKLFLEGLKKGKIDFPWLVRQHEADYEIQKQMFFIITIEQWVS